MKPLLLRSTLIWAGFFVLAFVNGALRELGIKKFVEEPWAHHFSVLTAIILFSIYLNLVWKGTGIRTSKEALLIGIYWMVLTVFAETFIVGRLIAKQSWDAIFAAYDVSQGSLWPLVVIWVAFLPSVFLKIKNNPAL